MAIAPEAYKHLNNLEEAEPLWYTLPDDDPRIVELQTLFHTNHTECEKRVRVKGFKILAKIDGVEKVFDNARQLSEFMNIKLSSIYSAMDQGTLIFGLRLTKVDIEYYE